MQRSKESQTCGTKQARQAYQHRTEQRNVCIKNTNTTKVYLTSGCIQQATRGMDETTQATGPKDRQAQTHGGHKACQSLDLDKQTWR